MNTNYLISVLVTLTITALLASYVNVDLATTAGIILLLVDKVYYMDNGKDNHHV